MNEIVAGYLEGSNIYSDPNKKLAYVGMQKYITKLEVSNVNIINTTNTVDKSSVIGGAIIAGGVGALVGATPSTELLIEICWNNGQKSIAKVTKETFDLMIIGLHTDYTQNQINDITEERYATRHAQAVADRRSLIWKFIIGLIWLFYFLIYCELN